MKSFDWNQWLKKHRVFSCLDVGSRKRLLDPEVSKEFTYPPESVVVAQGDTSNDIYFIASGSASVCLTGSAGNKIPITHLGSGDFFGEIASIQHKTRTASIIADEELIVLRVNGNEFLTLLQTNAELEFRLLLVISQRLRLMTQHFAVDVKELDEKFALFGHQLDATVAKLEANQRASDGKVQAELEATKVMFQETKKSAAHIIEDAQRHRSRVSNAFAAVTAVVTFILGAAGFFGIKEFKHTTEILENVQINVEEAETYRSEILEIRDTAKSISDSLRAQKDTIYGSLFGLFAGLHDGNSEKNYYNKIIMQYNINKQIPHLAKNIFKIIYQSKSNENSKSFFKLLEVNLGKSGCNEIDTSYRNPYIALLTDTLENDFTENERNEVLANYYLLAAKKLNSDKDYAQKKSEFINDFHQNFSSDFDLSDFQPHWIFAYSPDACKVNRNLVYEQIKSDVFCQIASEETKNYSDLCSS